ncbi:MAG: plasmid pRiA4b ORF-3 family protein [Balneolaceae bacterium]
MTSTIYQIHLELKGSKPKIWRKLLVPSDIPLSDLHKIIQTAMGWTNSHLHQFIKGRTFYEPPPPDGVTWESIGINYTGLSLNEFLTKENDRITYEYDFGDGWEHDVKLKKILPSEGETNLPKCIGGAMACPPEDCGGIWGYQEMLTAIKNPNHPEHEDYMEWLGEEFDHEYFNSEEINELLQDDNYGVFEW